MNAYEFIVKMRDYASSNLQNIAKSVGVTTQKVHGMNAEMNTVSQTSGRMGVAMQKLKGIIVGVFAVATISAFANKVMDARAEYEKFSAVLTNSYQSAEIGQAALNMLNQFATETPFALNELTGAFVKLVNRGFNPTKVELRKMGDLAASQGKGFDQLTEAILDAQGGEFERLKEFGIKASKSGDQVSFSFKNVTKTVNDNANSIRGAIMQYGDLTGVANSMDAVSKTVGGRISNLGDQWNNFLVAVGGESSGVISGVISMLGAGIEFLSSHLSDIATWFSVLGSYIEPVVNAVNGFLQAAFGFNDAGSILQTFGSIMNGVLMVVGWLTTGLTTLIDFLTPFAGVIAAVAAVWYGWNGVVAVFNALMLASPLTWTVIIIMSLITAIGMVAKYTDGWGKSWNHVVTGAKLLWQAYTDYVGANFNTLVNGLMIGINKIKEGWYSFKEAVGMGNSDENQKMLANIAADTERRKQSIADGYKKMIDSASAAKKEFSQVGITIDAKGMEKDWNALQSKFSVGGKTNTGTAAYDALLAGQGKGGAGGNANAGAGDKSKGTDSITSGGSKMTTINVSVEKLQDYTTINVSSAEKGLSSMGDKVEELLLRALNSANQLQGA